MNEFISVIVPIYNVENYVKECLDSIISQTFKRLEIILVDDGSTDSSGSICDEYVKLDTRVRVIHKTNGGLSSARNAGIEIATSEYIIFIDSDDFIAEDMLEKYYKLLKDNRSEMVYGSLLRFYGKRKKHKYNNREEKVEILDKLEAIKSMLLNDKLDNGAAGVLYKKELFENIRFPNGILYEDLATSYYIVDKCNKIVYYDGLKYYYRTRPGSIINSNVTQKNMVLLDISDRVAEFVSNKYPQLEIYSIRQRLINYMNLYYGILCVGFNEFKYYQNRIMMVAKENKLIFVKSSEIKIKEKIKILLLIYNKCAFFTLCTIRNYYHKLKQKMV